MSHNPPPTKVQRNCRRWNSIMGKVVCTTWRFSLDDRIGPYISFPNIPSPNGVIRQHPHHGHTQLDVTKVTCVAPISPIQWTNGLSQHRRIENQPLLVNEEAKMMGNSYHTLDLNFLFSGTSL